MKGNLTPIMNYGNSTTTFASDQQKYTKWRYLPCLSLLCLQLAHFFDKSISNLPTSSIVLNITKQYIRNITRPTTMHDKWDGCPMTVQPGPHEIRGQGMDWTLLNGFCRAHPFFGLDQRTSQPVRQLTWSGKF